MWTWIGQLGVALRYTVISPLSILQEISTLDNQGDKIIIVPQWLEQLRAERSASPSYYDPDHIYFSYHHTAHPTSDMKDESQDIKYILKANQCSSTSLCGLFFSCFVLFLVKQKYQIGPLVCLILSAVLH